MELLSSNSPAPGRGSLRQSSNLSATASIGSQRGRPLAGPSSASSLTSVAAAALPITRVLYDNALVGADTDSFKTELITNRVWRPLSQLELAIVEHLGRLNNCGVLSPVP
jgi:hypothetical protein